MCFVKPRPKRDRAIEACHCGVDLAVVATDVAEVVVSVGEVRPKLNRPLQRRDRFTSPPGDPQRRTECRMKLRIIRLRRRRALQQRCRRLVMAGLLRHQSQQVKRVNMIRLYRQNSPVDFLRLLQASRLVVPQCNLERLRDIHPAVILRDTTASMAQARSFRELAVYRLVRREALKIVRVSQKFPPEEQAALTEPMRRSSRAVGAMIADAWGRRSNPAAFSASITSALGEAAQTQAWLDHARDCHYITDEQHESLDAAWRQVGSMLTTMWDSAEEFCRGAITQRSE